MSSGAPRRASRSAKQWWAFAIALGLVALAFVAQGRYTLTTALSYGLTFIFFFLVLWLALAIGDWVRHRIR